jgi:xanthine dehydrogenase YagR molybdenum-binding subunit
MMSNFGQPITRADGPIKVTGAACYAGDQNQPAQLYGVFVASVIPAGRVTAIDAKAALFMPGVVRVLVATDLPRVHADLDKITVPPLATRFMPMQTDHIVHEGQPVAMVLAETLEAAEAGATASGSAMSERPASSRKKRQPRPLIRRRADTPWRTRSSLGRATRPRPSRPRA